MKTDQNIDLPNYNKMQDDNQYGSNVQLTVQPSPRCCDCKWQWPHKWTLAEAFCGCSVRTGSLCIGWFFMTVSFFMMFGSFLAPIQSMLRWEDVVLSGLKLVSSVVLLVGIYKHHVYLVRVSVMISLVDKLIEIVALCVLSAAIGHIFPFVIMLAIEPITIYMLVIVNSLANQMSMGLVKSPTLTV